jgi:hypothetical protein
MGALDAPPRRADADGKVEEANPMAARLRHIALSVSDPDKAAKFFEDAFGMKRVGKAGLGCYVSDGTINVALLKYDDEVPGFHKGYCGLVHFGMWSTISKKRRRT